MTSLSIIGTAGRKEDAAKLAANPKHYYTRMRDCARYVATLVGADTLVSGGAAWADMTAIILFLERPDYFNLRLELPAPLESGSGVATHARYHDTGSRDWQTNPGGTSNHYLSQYAKQCVSFAGRDFPWVQLGQVVGHPRVNVRVGQGFKDRNSEVAKADHCLAMTFGDGPRLKDGGTADTMTKFLAREGRGRSFHFDLNSMTFHEGAVV